MNSSAVPSLFLKYPAHKQCQPQRKRSSPKKRKLVESTVVQKTENHVKCIKLDHSYSCFSIEVDLAKTKTKLFKAKEQLTFRAKELKSVTAKLKRRECKISNLLDGIQSQKLLQEEEINILKDNFSEETLTLTENEVKANEKGKNGFRYSDVLKSFAVSLHFYSAAAYEFVRKHLHLPHSESIRKWASSIEVQPGFLSASILFLRRQLKLDQHMKDICLVYDAMSIRKELIYDHSRQSYAGFVNHGHLQTAAADTLATEVIVLLAVGLRRSFKQPIAYFLIDKLPATQQAQIIKQGISFIQRLDSKCILSSAMELTQISRLLLFLAAK